ncbi:MAG TPA: TatD family hydrolase [Gammaproteobacteria bacterium]|nr:TatD family hydrolase [Gammaproteobacteria bacterium]HRA43222.1 TatD family hydrolase [Gammaproteobacteria bacterium]
MLIDSHCHLNLINYTELGVDINAVVRAALDNDVLHMLCVGTNLKESEAVIRIAEQFPEVSASIGLHPNETVETEPTFDELVALAAHPKVIAIGETGLDYYRSEATQNWQDARFKTHIEVAKATKKPLIVHTRNARKDTLAILKAGHANECGGVLHCFTEDWDTASAALDLDFYISFSGIVTFKNAIDLQAVAKKLPLERILIETDSPWLAPIPYRGKINQPAYVKHVAEFLADLRGVTFEEIAKHTTQNFYRLFAQTRIES